jgi:predicted DNA-binding transcriptional regulator YafY
MEINKDKAKRFQIIEQLLKKGECTLGDIIFALTEQFGEEPSKSTVKQDIGGMRSLGAPIKTVRQRFYTYSDESFCINRHIPTFFDEKESEILSQLVVFLKQMETLPLYEDIENYLEPLMSKFDLKNKVLSVVGFDHVEVLGKIWFPKILKYILKKQRILIKYQPYGRKSMEMTMSPYYLKQYNHRWYVLGYSDDNPDTQDKGGMVINLALDRIDNVVPANDSKPFVENISIDFKTYFDDIIGVTHLEEEKEREDVLLHVDDAYMGYLRTRPLHENQTVKSAEKLVRLPKLRYNNELENTVFAISSKVEVLGPKKLREKIIKRLKDALEKQEKALED